MWNSFGRMNNMFSLFSLVFVLGTSEVSANELDVDCESPLNQSEILYCVTRNYERSEEMMVNLYKSISSKSDKLGKQYLMEGQVAFESFRKLSFMIKTGPRLRKLENSGCFENFQKIIT